MPLAGEDAEVVFPEIDHHFVELPVGDHGARERRRLYFAGQPLRLALGLGEFWILVDDVAARFSFVHRAVVRVGLFHLALQLLHEVVVVDDVAGLHVEDRVARHELLGLRVVDALRVELAVDPFVDAHRAHGRRVAWTGAKGQPVEHLLNLLVGQQLARARVHGRRGQCRLGRRRLGRCWFGRLRGARNSAGDAEDQGTGTHVQIP